MGDTAAATGGDARGGAAGLDRGIIAWLALSQANYEDVSGFSGSGDHP